MTERVYLDHNATTPLAPSVLETMTRYLETEFGNPSSGHHFGQAPRRAIATAQIAELAGTRPPQLVFTGCGSEANSLAIVGATAGRNGHVITQATEHPAVLETCKAFTGQGIRVTVLPVDEHCLVRPADLAKALSADTLLVSVMHANNETGTIQPITELAALAHEAGVADPFGKQLTKVRQARRSLLAVDFEVGFGQGGGEASDSPWLALQQCQHVRAAQPLQHHANAPVMFDDFDQPRCDRLPV